MAQAPTSELDLSAVVTRSEPPKTKPRLRGVSHQFAFFVVLLASVLLVARAQAGTARVAALVFCFSLANLLGTSALYHRIDWSPAARKRVRRLDHAAIFLLIGGGYTPLFALVPSTTGSYGALWAIWAGVVVGVLKSLVWPDAPKWMTACICVALGWTVAGQVIDRASVIGPLPIALLIASGCSYSIGAVIYALKRPDPLPRVFGYHEVFHAIVVLASVFLFAHVVTVLG